MTYAEGSFTVYIEPYGDTRTEILSDVLAAVGPELRDIGVDASRVSIREFSIDTHGSVSLELRSYYHEETDDDE